MSELYRRGEVDVKVVKERSSSSREKRGTNLLAEILEITKGIADGNVRKYECAR